MKKIILLTASILCATTIFAQNVNEEIMGQGEMSVDELQAFFIVFNPDNDTVRIARAKRLAQLYVEEAAMEGVNHDVAFAQMILETGWLRFSGLVKPEMNNFCGIGATGAKKTGHTFNTERDGVRAHIQHLKAYASADTLNNPVIDPRYDLVFPKGKSPTVTGLAGTWAVDMAYATKIKSLLQKMYQ